MDYDGPSGPVWRVACQWYSWMDGPLTWSVLPRPMQWARMQPEPVDDLAFFTDSTQQSQMNCTPADNIRDKVRHTTHITAHLVLIYDPCKMGKSDSQ